MKVQWLFAACMLWLGCLQAQNWNAYPAAALGVPYVNGVMTATVTRVNTTMNDGTPKFTTSTSPDCYIAAGCLALNAGFFNSYLLNASRIQVDIDFTSGGNNGTCNSAAFTIRDINSGESFTDFLDVVEISAIDGNNAAIVPGNIVVTPPANVTVVTVGNSKKIVGHNSSSEVVTGGPYFSTPCNLTSVSVSPPANTPLRSIRIIYRPAVGTNSSNAYYSVGIRPAVQYISISNLTMTPTGGGCSVLPAELASFEGKPEVGGNILSWTSNENLIRNGFFVEKSADGSSYLELGKVESELEKDYQLLDPTPFPQTFYRLLKIDQNGGKVALATLMVQRADFEARLFTLTPNPANSEAVLETFSPGLNQFSLFDTQGKQVFHHSLQGIGQETLDVSHLSEGMYLVRCTNSGKVNTKRLMISH